MAKTRDSIGIDLGAGGIKAASLAREKKGVRLVTYGFTERSVGEMGNDWLADIDGTAALIRKICDRAHITGGRASTALPIASVFSSVINLPVAVSKGKELEAAVQWEAKKLIPLPLEEVILDWKILPPVSVLAKGKEEKGAEKKEKMVEVLLTGAPKALVQKYIEVFKKAGFTLGALETESFAFIRSLVGNDLSLVAIVDIGARKSNIVFVDRGVPFLSRSIEIGGKNFTDRIADVLKMPVERAEEVKRNISELSALQSLPDLIKGVITPLLNEIKYSFDVYRTRNGGTRPLEKIILTGGSSALPKLSEHFTEFFNLRTFQGDPWARLQYPEELKPVLQSIGARFSVALGLAMREI
ncbi:MAG: type IV pilus assembly protein PilM [Patescibacteria group bacterium]